MRTIPSCCCDFSWQVSDTALKSRLLNAIPPILRKRHLSPNFPRVASRSRTRPNRPALLLRRRAARGLAKMAIWRNIVTSVEVIKTSVQIGGRYGNVTRNPSGQNRGTRPPIECYYCHKIGHFQRECRTRERGIQYSRSCLRPHTDNRARTEPRDNRANRGSGNQSNVNQRSDYCRCESQRDDSPVARRRDTGNESQSECDEESENEFDESP